MGFSPLNQTSPERGFSPGHFRTTKADRDLFASDVLRYFLLREIPFGQDGSFSFDALITRYNADLANGYGNLVSRTLNMIEKYFDSEYLCPATRFRLTIMRRRGSAKMHRLRKVALQRLSFRRTAIMIHRLLSSTLFMSAQIFDSCDRSMISLSSAMEAAQSHRD